MNKTTRINVNDSGVDKNKKTRVNFLHTSIAALATPNKQQQIKTIEIIF
jgi:hypothetical protein